MTDHTDKQTQPPALYFRPLTPADFPRLLDWLARPHVKQWWDDGDDTLEKVAEHYGADEPDLARVMLIETGPAGEEQPLGYFQYYLLPDGAVGIDQFIGEESRINQGLGTRAVRQFLDLIMTRLNPPRIILDPDPANARAIRCYEKAGFRHYETIPTEDGGLAYMMQIATRSPDASD